MSLAGLRVLVTRPRERAAPLVQAIENEGGEAVVAPMLDICDLDPEADAERLARNRQLLASLDSYHKLIFISVNAVEYGLQQWRECAPALPVSISVYAIGKATASALEKAGIRVSAQAENMTSESLLQCRDFQQLAGEQVLIIRGVGGREHLAAQLRQRGARVDYLECYRRQPPEMSVATLQALIAGKELHAITVNSGETLLHLTARLKQIDEALLTVPIITPSERVASLAREQQFTQVVVADNAGVEATLAALNELAT